MSDARSNGNDNNLINVMFLTTLLSILSAWHTGRRTVALARRRFVCVAQLQLCLQRDTEYK